VGFVLIGLALIASAFSNLPVQVSGPVNVRLSRPRRAPGSDHVRNHRLCFVAARPGPGCSILRITLRQPGLMEAKARTLITPGPGVNIGVPLPPNRPSEAGSGSWRSWLSRA